MLLAQRLGHAEEAPAAERHGAQRAEERPPIEAAGSAAMLMD
jgi:hypothetical protein